VNGMDYEPRNGQTDEVESEELKASSPQPPK